MGHLQRGELAAAYQRIRRDAAGRTCSILILVTPTVDALCALKVLTELLKSDLLPFKVVPVAGYDGIVAANDNFIQGREEIRSVVMIDCGATVDLAELLSLSPAMTVYVVDSHRPHSLFNIFSNSQLLILDDGFIEENMADLREAFEATRLDDSDSDDGQDEEDEEDSGNDNESGNGGEPQDENALPDDPNRGTHEQRRGAKRGRAHREACRRKHREYYQDGSWYGTSVARLVFDLSDGLGRNCKDYLWCSILGVTSQQIMELNSSAAYAAEVSWLRERALQLGREDAGPAGEAADRDGRIRYEPEFRFMLTRHWTLFNSMLHSRYLATRLAVWREKGRRMLETFIVKMGVPLAQCKLDYASMETELKESLPARISKHAAEFGIGDILFPSFVRDFGYVVRLSASDAVYAVMALIEAPYEAAEGAAAGSLPADDGSPVWVRNFYFAFDALDYHNIDKLRRGIQLAMKQQQIVMNEATTVLSHRLLHYGRRFRYVVLRHTSDLAWLSNHPLSLAKLALFLAEATRGSRRGHTPLVLAAHQSASDTYLVVAATPPLEFPATADGAAGFEPSRNPFGLAFRRAGQSVRARVKHDGFESALIEVRADDLKPFLQTLQKIPLP